MFLQLVQVVVCVFVVGQDDEIGGWYWLIWFDEMQVYIGMGVQCVKVGVVVDVWKDWYYNVEIVFDFLCGCYGIFGIEMQFVQVRQYCQYGFVGVGFELIQVVL